MSQESAALVIRSSTRPAFGKVPIYVCSQLVFEISYFGGLAACLRCCGGGGLKFGTLKPKPGKRSLAE